jgi:hypothetical protein
MYSKKKEDCMDGHTLRRNGLPKHIIEVQLEGTRMKTYVAVGRP